VVVARVRPRGRIGIDRLRAAKEAGAVFNQGHWLGACDEVGSPAAALGLVEVGSGTR
jgi:hypothetical protein